LLRPLGAVDGVGAATTRGADPQALSRLEAAMKASVLDMPRRDA